ncbi:Lys48-specific deubiquitinase Mindy family, Miy1 [Schizosaccharomyces pombe]|uniref:Uncharacterized protein C12G12.11c n=1 Tax=Schizosaccharomyces pombe (strain 972 / ATCC 24843) TaxID=284812 RepID=YAGB_SCHPO|nr:uncharacterized protein SPAC12G12.11c [Schizosaccharomyces pombe]Q09874.1 RecName: Full=Uncharacterized protein C12G12.11c [Schizosaccharomyces pombe 972h-]CAA91506.1 DUF544 family protein [Schizosaccharomyces pombe]|eukprot:NP_592887.1 uncharacterized protein SPAC12G12.11c [Schizosaccharomyces pombe]
MDNVQEHDPDTQEHNNETQNHKQEDHSNSYQTRTIPFIEPLSREYQKRIILCQTVNGPCPIIALSNALILKSNVDRPFELPKKRYITPDELTEYLVEFAKAYGLCKNQQSLQDKLTSMHFGQQLNPCLYDIEKFEYGHEIFCTFGVRLVHGWILSDDMGLSDEDLSYLRKLEYYEKVADTFAERRSLLEMQEPLTEQQQDFLNNSTCVDKVMENRYTMQFLTNAGLKKILELVGPGEIVVVFRSSHFSTMYSNPDSFAQFTLVTDSGYARTGEDVVWETFDSQTVETGNGELCAANFIPAVYVLNQRKEEKKKRAKDDEQYAKRLAKEEEERGKKETPKKASNTPRRNKSNTQKSRKQSENCLIS